MEINLYCNCCLRNGNNQLLNTCYCSNLRYLYRFLGTKLHFILNMIIIKAVNLKIKIVFVS